MESQNPFEYDKALLESSMIKIGRVRAVKRPRLLQSLSHNQLVSAMTIDYHRIEKGLAMAQPIANFGDKSGVLRRLWNMVQEYRRRYGQDCQDTILIIIRDCVREYQKMHDSEHLDTEISSPFVSKLISTLAYLDESLLVGGTVMMTPHDVVGKFTEIQDNFFSSRHSIRQFSPVVDNTLKAEIRAAIAAAISGTPTVCNRRLNKVYMFSRSSNSNAYHNSTPTNIDRLLELQNGNRGFGGDIPVLLVVNTCLDAFQDEKERRQPYISGGMFAMSLIYALHARGLATCSLNWDCTPDNDRRLRELLVSLDKVSRVNSQKETCIMYIAVGRYPDIVRSNDGETGFSIAASYKSPIEYVLVE